MCGRFSLSLSPSQWIEYFDLDQPPDFESHYNIAPGQNIPVLREEQGGRRLALLRWGLIPPWARDASVGNRMINARRETLAEKPSFKNAFKTQRCVIPASGFFEWQKAETGKKRPFFIFRPDRKPIAFAGLWEHWTDRETGEVIDSCTIITTGANLFLKEIHDRMPVILGRPKIEGWLGAGSENTGRLQAILEFPGEVGLDHYPVSEYVNKAGNEGEKCIEPVSPAGG